MSLPEDMARFREEFECLMRTARSIMRHLGLADEGDPVLTRVNLIKQIVADYYSLPTTVLSSPTRTDNYVRPRQIAIHLCKEFVNIDNVSLGKAFNRNSRTVVFSCRAVTDHIQTDPAFAATVNTLRLRCAGHFPETFIDQTAKQPLQNAS